jgi:hypothetical protein
MLATHKWVQIQIQIKTRMKNKRNISKQNEKEFKYPSPRVCQNLLGKSGVLPTSKKLCKVKKEFIPNSLA